MEGYRNRTCIKYELRVASSVSTSLLFNLWAKFTPIKDYRVCLFGINNMYRGLYATAYFK